MEVRCGDLLAGDAGVHEGVVPRCLIRRRMPVICCQLVELCQALSGWHFLFKQLTHLMVRVGWDFFLDTLYSSLVA